MKEMTFEEIMDEMDKYLIELEGLKIEAEMYLKEKNNESDDTYRSRISNDA